MSSQGAEGIHVKLHSLSQYSLGCHKKHRNVYIIPLKPRTPPTIAPEMVPFDRGLFPRYCITKEIQMDFLKLTIIVFNFNLPYVKKFKAIE